MTGSDEIIFPGDNIFLFYAGLGLKHLEKGKSAGGREGPEHLPQTVPCHRSRCSCFVKSRFTEMCFGHSLIYNKKGRKNLFDSSLAIIFISRFLELCLFSTHQNLQL